MKKGTNLLLIILIGMIGILCSGEVEAANKEVKVAVQPSDLPDIIKESIESKFSGGKIIEIQKELDGQRLVQYDAVIGSGQKVLDVEISPEGKIIETKERKTTAASSPKKQEQQWTQSFNMEERTFSTTGSNPYFILQPGHQMVLENENEKVVMTVLKETKVVDGIETRILEEREWADGELAEVSRNFFAVCKETNDVFYFGEEVDDYKDGKIVGHGGAWEAGKNGATAGIVMPGTFLLGSRYYQEISPDVAMDRAEHVAEDFTMDTPAGKFEHCVKVIETSPLESGKSTKIYAPGIGMIYDDGLKLTEVKKAKSK
ncbi:MAG: hypothetical protein OEV87_13405 [Phycisphaerae bacterium]|nr:hypothetical protein [Phycisphaerae bacterium]